MSPSDLIDRDEFAKLLGITLLERRAGYAKASMPITPSLKNGAGFVQGGAIFSLADYTSAAAFNAGEEFGMTVTSTVSFINNFQEGTFYAEATEVCRGKKIAFYQVKITNENDKIVSEISVTAYYSK